MPYSMCGSPPATVSASMVTFGDGGVRRDVVHDRHQDAFDDAAQTAGTALALNGLAGDRVQGLVGEDQLNTVHAQQLFVLLDQAVLGLGENTHQSFLVQRPAQ